MHLAFSVWFVIFHIHGMLYLVFQIGFIIILSDFNAMLFKLHGFLKFQVIRFNNIILILL